MKETFEIIVNPPEERLDLALLGKLRERMPDLSRLAVKKLFAERKVLVNGKIANASLRLKPGRYPVELVNFDEGTLVKEAHPSPEGCFLPIIYEDDTLLILHKHSGVPSLPHTNSETHTAVSAALARYPELPRSPEKPLEPGLLHRLDTLTSGILAFAKTPTEYARLRALWKTPDVKKIYRAVATSAPETPPPPNLIQWPIAHDAKKAKLMRAIKEKNGIRGIRGEPLPAKTRIISHQSISPVSRDFEIEITTGVMHQIRCHFSAAGWPLAGDPIYGGTPAPRLWLHAWRLSLPLSSGELLHLEAALPPEWPV